MTAQILPHCLSLLASGVGATADLRKAVALAERQGEPAGQRLISRPISDVENVLKVGNGVVLVVTTYEPVLGAAAPQQGTEVVGINKNACLYRQVHHLLWGVGTVELPLHISVTVHLMAEVIQRIQQRFRCLAHAAFAGRSQRYAGSRIRST